MYPYGSRSVDYPFALGTVSVSRGWFGDFYVNSLLSAMRHFEKMDSPVKPGNDVLEARGRSRRKF
jgi:hypothetical protein